MKLEKSRMTYEERKAQRRGEWVWSDKSMKNGDIRSYVRNFNKKKKGKK